MVSKLIINIIFISCLLAGVACNKTGTQTYTIKSPDDINEFVQEQKHNTNLNYSKKINDINYTLNYISNEQMALKQINDLSSLNQVQFDSIVHNYDSLLFFNLEISIDNFNDDLLKYNLKGDVEFNYSQLVEYYSFKMQKDINLVQNNRDTIPCVLYHYERNYGISPKTTIMLGFKPVSLKNMVFVYENKHLNTGTIKFAIQEKEIVNHPHIKIG